MNTSTESLVRALQMLAEEIESDDGVANVVCAQAATRITECCELLAEQTAWATALAGALRDQGWEPDDFDHLRQSLENWGED